MTHSGLVGISVVGCGHIGKRHIRTIAETDGARLSSVCDSDPYVREELQKLGVPVFDDLEDMLKNGPVSEVLAIATPNGLHASQALAGMNSGRHVLIEKPMSLSTDEADQIIRLSEKTGKKVFCVMQNRYSPPARWLRELLDKELLGKIFMIQVNCFWNRDSRYYRSGGWRGTSDLDGGTLFTQFSHFVDVLCWLFGEIKAEGARFEDFNHADLTDFEDSGIIHFSTQKGAMGVLSYSTSVWDRNFESSLTIIAENGTVKIGGQYMNELSYCHVRDLDVPRLDPSPPANDYGSYTGSASNHAYIYNNLISVLRDEGAIGNTAEEGKKVVQLIETIYSTNPYIRHADKRHT